MQYLFSPFRIKNLELPNRIVMPSVASFLIETDGTITAQAVEHYRRRAAGGPAMVIMEACAVSPEGVVSPHQARIDHDRHVEGLAKIAAAMKAEGCIPALQIHHGGRQISPRVIGQKALAPSPLPCPAIGAEVTPMTQQDIHEMVQKFGDAADRAFQAGFELIEVHGAHGYLVNQFLSSFSNIREDEYGGDAAGRTRFAAEIVAELRRRLGPEFPISFKISAQEFVPDGLTVPQSIDILKILIDAGMDLVQVSAGNDATPEWICQPMFMEKACLADSAGQIKQALDVPVMAVGRINDPAVAEAVIAEQKADLVCIGRGLLADPEMPHKARAGQLDDIMTCIACNTCMESIFKKGRIECLVNPTLGREMEMAIVPTPSPKRVMVIGGGPAGMNTAWVAAKRGHSVDLFERQSALGGQLIPGSQPGYKKELKNLIRFQRTQVAKNQVNCHLNHEVTPADIREVDPDVIVLATGSRPALPSVDGIDKDIVVTYEAVLNAAQWENRCNTIIGGGPTGCEIALHLAEFGCDVTIVEMLPRIGKLLESMTRKIMLAKLAEYDVTLLASTRLLRIADSGVWVIDQSEEEHFIPTDRVVIATGTRPDTHLYDTIKSLGYKIYQIGDCLEPRSAKAAIYEAAKIGRAI